MFWSDLGPKITFEAIGIIDSTLPTVAIYAKSKEEESSEKSPENVNKNIFYFTLFSYIFCNDSITDDFVERNG